MEKKYSQKNIEEIWDEVWKATPADPKPVFNNNLFKYGYRAYKPYVILQPGSVFLEIGAGSGRYGFAFAKDFPESEFVLTDPTLGSINYMKKMQNLLQLKNIQISIADATRLDFYNNSIDTIFADCVVQHITDHQKALAEMVRVLKPGGALIVSAVNPQNLGHSLYKKILKFKGTEYEYGYERCFSGRELKQEFKKQQLTKIQIAGFYSAYGILRHKHKSKWLARLGVLSAYLEAGFDKFTNRWWSRHFGFEVFVVGIKPHEKTEH